MKMRAQVLELEPKTKAIVVVAHPDDEVIWMGGALMRFAQVDWTVLSLSRSSDADRAPKFARVCDKLGVKGVIEDLADEGEIDETAWIAQAKQIIKNQANSFDFLFTHGENGEYGHENHKMTHQAVMQLFDEKDLPVENVFCFDYQRKDRKILPMIPVDEPEVILELTPEEYEEKRRIVAEMYGYPYDGIDVNLCTNVESFRSYSPLSSRRSDSD